MPGAWTAAWWRPEWRPALLTWQERGEAPLHRAAAPTRAAAACSVAAAPQGLQEGKGEPPAPEQGVAARLAARRGRANPRRVHAVRQTGGAAPEEPGMQVEAQRPAEAGMQVEAQRPAEAGMQVEAQRPAEAGMQVEAQRPAEAATQRRPQVATLEAAAPGEAAAPAPRRRPARRRKPFGHQRLWARRMRGSLAPRSAPRQRGRALG